MIKLYLIFKLNFQRRQKGRGMNDVINANKITVDPVRSFFAHWVRWRSESCGTLSTHTGMRLTNTTPVTCDRAWAGTTMPRTPFLPSPFLPPTPDHRVEWQWLWWDTQLRWVWCDVWGCGCVLLPGGMVSLIRQRDGVPGCDAGDLSTYILTGLRPHPLWWTGCLSLTLQVLWVHGFDIDPAGVRAAGLEPWDHIFRIDAGHLQVLASLVEGSPLLHAQGPLSIWTALCVQTG